MEILAQHLTAEKSTYQNLVEKVLYKLFLERSAGQKSMQIGTQKLSHEVDIFEGRNEDVAQ